VLFVLFVVHSFTTNNTNAPVARRDCVGLWDCAFGAFEKLQMPDPISEFVLFVLFVVHS
jgi:hypothetical protein